MIQQNVVPFPGFSGYLWIQIFLLRYFPAYHDAACPNEVYSAGRARIHWSSRGLDLYSVHVPFVSRTARRRDADCTQDVLKSKD
jgi:hypothetical protein